MDEIKFLVQIELSVPWIQTFDDVDWNAVLLPPQASDAAALAAGAPAVPCHLAPPCPWRRWVW